MSDGRRLRLLHVVSHPVQYFAPLYREVATRPDVDLTVVFADDRGVRATVDREFGVAVRWDADLLGGYRSLFLPTAPARAQSALIAAILRARADAIWIHGYTPWHSVLAAAIGRLLRIPVLMREEATLLDDRPRARRIAKRLLLGRLSAFVHGLFIGTRNRDFFSHYGFPPSRLTFAPYSVDNDRFAADAARLLPERQRLRAEFGVPADAFAVLFSGKLVARKDPLSVLRAVQRLQEDGTTCALLYAGDGPLRRELEAEIARLACRNVRIIGFLNQSAIGEAYAASDVLVLPSVTRETWGLVVNEAMNFERPIVTSDRVGCAADLVLHDRNGFVFPASDVGALAAALHRLADASVRAAFGAESRRIIDRWSVTRTADGIVAGAHAAVGTRPS